MQQPHTYRHIFFDMDGTLTPANTVLDSEMKGLLQQLMDSGRDVMVVSGQIAPALKTNVGVGTYFMSQNGNNTIDAKTGKELWCDSLSDAEKKEITDHISSIPIDWEVEDEDDLVMDRGCQVSFSLLGYHANKELKNAFDPDFSKRLKILKEHPFDSKTLTVSVGGTTTFDYIKKGRDKGYNVNKLIETMGWNKAECLYIGDALFEDGNDEAVIGVIDTRQVANPEETKSVIREVLKNE